jgi:hypothetical protein
MAEALAEFSALCKAWKGGYKRVILTTDCLISTTSCDGLCIGTVVRDFKNMTADTESCIVKFFVIKRMWSLINWLGVLSLYSVVGVIPEFIRKQLCNDIH